MLRYLVWSVPAALISILLLWNGGSVLTISSNDTQDILWSHPVSEGDQFVIRYTHSVDRTDVDEVIRVTDDELIIDSTIYESFGAGLPSTIQQGQSIRREDGKVIIDNINRVIPRIDLFIGQVIANHIFLFQEQIIPLHTLSKPGSSIRFSVTKEKLIERLWGRLWH